MTAHINKYRQMADELANVGAPVTEVQLEERILTTLPPSYHAAVAAWDTLPRDANRYITQLTARMVLKETRIKARTGGIQNTADVAFFATHPSRQRKPPTEEKLIDNCYAAGSEHNGGRGGQEDGPT